MTPEQKAVRLGRLGLEIMKVVWERGECTVQEVKDALSPGRKRAYNTILTTMRKLEAKGFLEHDVDGRTFVYRAAIDQRSVRHSMLGDLLDRLFEGSPQLLFNSLVEQKRISAGELREIRKLVRGRGGKHGESGE